MSKKEENRVKKSRKKEKRKENILLAPIDLPCIVLSGFVMLPNLLIHFDLSGKRALDTVNKAMMQIEQEVFITTQKDIGKESSEETEEIYEIGVLAKIRQVVKMPNQSVRILVESGERARLMELSQKDEFLVARVQTFSKEKMMDLEPEEAEAMRREISERFLAFVSYFPRVAKAAGRQTNNGTEDLGDLLDSVAANLPIDPEKKQAVLEEVPYSSRFKLVNDILKNEVNIAKLRYELAEKVKGRVDEDQKAYFLREQLRSIREELGEGNTEDEADKYLKQLEELQASEEVKTRIKKEIDRFRNTPSGSSESGVEQIYIETLLEMPWEKLSEENRSLDRAEEILERDHYGLEKVKERMLEFLAVKNLTEKGQSPIILLVGPPGTGKTSIAKSIAEALERKYIRISLGGVKDEAEIRGHRKTYVGAMPGVIASGLQRCGVRNPLILLDEVDKVSSDYRGATASALLEVLDSEQNKYFRDHYIEIPLDLSEVLFIATANSTQTIPAPLLDRMEVVEVSGYTANEKFHIAHDHLLKKQIEKNGLKRGNLKISDAALRVIIDQYTKEAGVRSLERRIGEICRKTAKAFCKEGKKSISVNPKNLEKYLGKPRYLPEDEAGEDAVGIVRGLAWTSVGGVTMEIEVNIMPGKGELLLTGKLGDVMKESARAGLTYIRSISSRYGIGEDYFRKHDFHIHIPEGAVPKDGPSAGITMATALFSAVTDIPVKAKVAMTGEITLRGRVLPIGGLKEKILAAKTAKITTVLVPVKNRRDVEEISEEIKGGLDIRFVEHMDEVLNTALSRMPEAKPRTRGRQKKA
ncbi:MAG: endopeptidase La [Lachnospiraceae bacterium]|nr:endopeptidase La [Lachnospiraceae bacterium]